MSYIAEGGEKITSSEGVTLANLNTLANSATTEFLAKVGGVVVNKAQSAGSGTVTSVSVTTANGVSGSVATSTTTPAITLTLGAITPTSVNSVVVSGSATPTLAVTGTSSISGSNTGDQTGGTPSITLGTANTAGSSPNFLRRDDTILAFDATAPSTQAFGDAAAVGVATVAARRDHKHAMMSAPTSVTGNAGTVTGATFTKTLTVDTGNVRLSGDAGNTSYLSIGAGATSVSGSNTGDNTVATALTGTPSITVNTVTTTGNIELGNASDTTITRVSSGVLAIEGNNILTANVGDTSKLPLAGGTMTGKIVKAGTTEVGKTYTPATGSQTVTIDCSVNNVHVVTGHASGTAITFAISNATSSQPFIVSILQGSSTVSTIAAWFATVRWAGGSAPTLTATLNKRDTFGFIRTGTDTYDGFIIGQNA